jgi:hypothetical protein
MRASWSPKAVATSWWRDREKIGGLGLIVAQFDAYLEIVRVTSSLL